MSPKQEHYVAMAALLLAMGACGLLGYVTQSRFLYCPRSPLHWSMHFGTSHSLAGNAVLRISTWSRGWSSSRRAFPNNAGNAGGPLIKGMAIRISSPA